MIETSPVLSLLSHHGTTKKSTHRIRLSTVVSYGLEQSRIKSSVCGVVTNLIPLWNALRLPSAGHRPVGNPVEKDHTTERYNHFLKSERDREQATHVEVDHDTDST